MRRLTVLLACFVAGCDGSSTPTPRAPLTYCNTEWAERAFTTAQNTPLIRGVDMSVEEGVVVLVGQRQWDFLNLDEQKVLAAAIDCAIAGNGNHLKLVQFRAQRSGPVLYAVDSIGLYRLREEGYGQGPGG